jgi:chorismate mutase
MGDAAQQVTQMHKTNFHWFKSKNVWWLDEFTTKMKKLEQYWCAWCYFAYLMGKNESGWWDRTSEKEANVAVLQNKRWNEILGKMILEGEKKGAFWGVYRLFKAIHQESIGHQDKV